MQTCSTTTILLIHQFDFSSRFQNWKHLSPSCLVDTTFVRIRQPSVYQWEYYNSNKKDYTLQYQVVCSLGHPFRIISFDGPYKGAAADVSVFRATILPQLKEKERVMTDKGYHQEKRCWHPPTGKFASLTASLRIMRRKVTRIRHLNERIIGRIKQWHIFTKRWNYSFEFHELCANVAARITNLEVSAFVLT